MSLLCIMYNCNIIFNFHEIFGLLKMVGGDGLEPPTFSV